MRFHILSDHSVIGLFGLYGYRDGAFLGCNVLCAAGAVDSFVSSVSMISCLSTPALMVLRSFIP